MNNYSTIRMKKLLTNKLCKSLKPEYEDKAGRLVLDQNLYIKQDFFRFSQLFSMILFWLKTKIILISHRKSLQRTFGRSELVTCINLFTPCWSETFRKTEVWIQMVPKGSHSSKLTHGNITLRGSDVHDVSTKDTRLDKRLQDPSLELITYPPGRA